MVHSALRLFLMLIFVKKNDADYNVPHKSVVKECICRKCGCTLEYTPNDVYK